MENFNVIEILKVGLPGLVFLLSFFSFKLLTREQVKNNPSQVMLKSIKHFMHISITLAILTAGAPFLEKYVLKSVETQNNNLTPIEISELIRDGLKNEETSGPYVNSILSIIEDESLNSSLSEKLFDLIDSRKKPFKFDPVPVKLFHGDDVPEGFVSVCDNSRFSAKNIVVFVTDKGELKYKNSFYADATRTVPCSDNQEILRVNLENIDTLQRYKVLAKRTF